MLAVVGTLSYNFTVVFPLFVEHALHGSDASYTIIYSVFSAGALVGAVAVADRKTVRVANVVVGAAAFGVSMLVLAAAPTVATTLPIVAVLGFTSIVFMTSTTAIVQVRADPRMQGRVLALQTVLLIGTTPVGGPLMGVVADTAGARVPLVIGGVAALLAALFGLVAGRTVLADRERERPRPSTAPTPAASEAALG
jgi:MFS family permease